MSLPATAEFVAQFMGWLDLAGVAVFAVSGALEAARREMDLLGFVLVGSVTGIGGGTLRDLLLGSTPVFWIAEPVYISVCVGAAVLTFAGARLLASRLRALMWMDAAGLAVFAVTGTQAALAQDVSPIIAAGMGMMTATFGGFIRDIMCNDIPLILRSEIYATAALAGAGVYVGLDAAGLAGPAATLAALATGFGLRAVAIVTGLSLPKYRRPG